MSPIIILWRCDRENFDSVSHASSGSLWTEILKSEEWDESRFKSRAAKGVAIFWMVPVSVRGVVSGRIFIQTAPIFSSQSLRVKQLHNQM